MTLTNYVQEVSLADFGKPFHHKAYWNKRLKTTGGRFFPKDGHLDFNPRMLEEHGELIFRKIVRHELCHYHLYFEGRGYHHKDRDFKDLLAQVNGLRYVPTSSKSKTNHYYSCQTCGQVYQRKRRINLAKYVCGNCHGKLMEKNQS
ncbi:TPA: SprT family protein [Streptococcus pyogenes]|nr:SprT family protein [Streptococcus pyogenes]HEP5995553.1 SprT family protein [Streptococcus pyogenes]